MDQRRNSGFSLNAKFKTMHQMVADKKLQKELGNIEQEFARDTNKRRKETLAIKQEFFKLQKEKGALNANSLAHLELSPGIQDRNTRSKRFGAFDPAMLKAKDDIENEHEQDNRSFAEKRIDSLIQNHLSSVPTVETKEKLADPYKRSLDRLLDNSKMAKEARITALKVKALEAMQPRPTNGNWHSDRDIARRGSTESTMTFSETISRRSRILSMPNATLSRPSHLLNRGSLSEPSVNMDHGSFSDMKKSSITGRARTRKRSNSLAPPVMNLRVEQHLSRRRSDTPLSSAKIHLGLIAETSFRNASTDKLPDITHD